MKLIATTRTTATEEIEVEGDDYSALKAELDAQVPEGFVMLNVRRGD